MDVPRGRQDRAQGQLLEAPRVVDARLRRRGLWLVYATIAWNVTEIVLLSIAAIRSRSVALAGFALDSCVEIFASLVVVRELRRTIEEEQERRSLRLIGAAFFLVSLAIAAQSALTLALGIEPDASALGIAWLSATCLAMVALAAGKARVGRRLDHPVLRAEAKVTLIDGGLAAGILVGLVLNAALGWWWADLAGGAVLVVYGIREGLEHVR